MTKKRNYVNKKAIKPDKKPIAQDKSWIFIICALLIIPVIYSESAIDQVLVPRFLGLSILLLIYFLIVIFRPKAINLEFNLLGEKAFWSWGLFIVFSVLSMINATNPVEGLFDIFRTCILFFFLLALSNTLIQLKNFNSIYISLILLAVIYLAVGYYQYFNNAFGHHDLKSLYKVIGIWTHKNFFSSMLYLISPVLLYKLLTDLKNRGLIALLLVLLYTLLFVLQTRSVWLSVIMFHITAAVFMLIFRKGIFVTDYKKNLFSGFVYSGGVLLLATLLAWSLTSISVNKGSHRTIGKQKTEQSTTSGEQPGKNQISSIDERAASMFDTKESNTQHRIEMWKMSLKMIADHPLIGIGSGNWKIVVADYLPKDYNASYFNNIRRPHNDLLWIFSEKGVFAFISYLAFFVLILIYSIKLLVKEENPERKILVAICISAIAGYFADSCLSFPHERIEHQIMLMFYASVIIALHFKSLVSKKEFNIIKKYQRSFSILSIILLGISVILGRIWLKAEININKAVAATLQNEWRMAIDFIDNSSTSVDQLDARNTPALWYSGKAYLQLNDLVNAQEDLEKAYMQNPNSLLVNIDLGTVYAKKEEFDRAIELFKKAVRIYPKSKEGWQSLGTAYYFSSRYKEALDSYLKLASIEYNPEVEKLIEDIKRNKLKL